MIIAMAMIWTVVLNFPSQEGRKPRNPVMMLMAAAPTTMNTSRLITATVTQKGIGRWLGKGWGKTLLMESTTNAVTSTKLNTAAAVPNRPAGQPTQRALVGARVVLERTHQAIGERALPCPGAARNSQHISLAGRALQALNEFPRKRRDGVFI